MPAGMREQLKALVDQAAAAAPAADQFDPAALAGALDGLQQTESMTLGLAIDMDKDRVYVESQSRMVAGSAAGVALGDMAKGAATVATAATADGKPPAVALHLAAAVPDNLRQAAIDGLAGMRAGDDAPANAETAVALLRAALASMIEAGGYDAAIAIDTSVVKENAGTSLPAVTAGMKVKDGPALEAKIKKLVADAGKLPGLEVELDAGKAAGANLHRLTLSDAADDPIAVTLAVAPAYCFVLAGGDVPKRLAAVAGASGKPDPNVKPIADVSVALGPLLRYVAAVGRAQGDAPADPEGLEAAATVADAQPSALVQLIVRPIERGMALRLSADAGAVRTVAASVKPQRGPAVPGIPATGGPDPIPFPIPIR